MPRRDESQACQTEDEIQDYANDSFQGQTLCADHAGSSAIGAAIIVRVKMTIKISPTRTHSLRGGMYREFEELTTHLEPQDLSPYRKLLPSNTIALIFSMTVGEAVRPWR